MLTVLLIPTSLVLISLEKPQSDEATQLEKPYSASPTLSPTATLTTYADTVFVCSYVVRISMPVAQSEQVGVHITPWSSVVVSVCISQSTLTSSHPTHTSFFSLGAILIAQQCMREYSLGMGGTSRGSSGCMARFLSLGGLCARQPQLTSWSGLGVWSLKKSWKWVSEFCLLDVCMSSDSSSLSVCSPWLLPSFSLISSSSRANSSSCWECSLSSALAGECSADSQRLLGRSLRSFSRVRSRSERSARYTFWMEQQSFFRQLPSSLLSNLCSWSLARLFSFWLRSSNSSLPALPSLPSRALTSPSSCESCSEQAADSAFLRRQFSQTLRYSALQQLQRSLSSWSCSSAALLRRVSSRVTRCSSCTSASSLRRAMLFLTSRALLAMTTGSERTARRKESSLLSLLITASLARSRSFSSSTRSSNCPSFSERYCMRSLKMLLSLDLTAREHSLRERGTLVLGFSISFLRESSSLLGFFWWERTALPPFLVLRSETTSTLPLERISSSGCSSSREMDLKLFSLGRQLWERRMRGSCSSLRVLRMRWLCWLLREGSSSSEIWVSMRLREWGERLDMYSLSSMILLRCLIFSSLDSRLWLSSSQLRSILWYLRLSCTSCSCTSTSFPSSCRRFPSSRPRHCPTCSFSSSTSRSRQSYASSSCCTFRCSPCSATASSLAAAASPRVSPSSASSSPSLATTAPTSSCSSAFTSAFSASAASSLQLASLRRASRCQFCSAASAASWWNYSKRRLILSERWWKRMASTFLAVSSSSAMQSSLSVTTSWMSASAGWLQED